jgi:hypothetical protein
VSDAGVFVTCEIHKKTLVWNATLSAYSCPEPGCTSFITEEGIWALRDSDEVCWKCNNKKYL